MNLLQSTKTYDELLTLVEACGYSTLHIKRVKREINWLTVNQDDYGITSYEEAYRITLDLMQNSSIFQNPWGTAILSLRCIIIPWSHGWRTYCVRKQKKG